MSSPHKQPPARVPTLTEVVALDATASTVQTPPAAEGDAEDLAGHAPDESRPLHDPLFEQRLREALAPDVEALLQNLLNQFRSEFDTLLREAVARALARGPSKPP